MKDKDLIKVEGNLCEYPFFLLSKPKKKISFKEYEFGEVELPDGERRKKKLTVFSPEGMDILTSFDQDVLMAIFSIGMKENTLMEHIHFTCREVAKLLGQINYKSRVKKSILKMGLVSFLSERTILVKDKKNKNRYLTEENLFHVFERVNFLSKYEKNKRKAKEKTYVKINDFFLENFLSGYFQYISFSSYLNLNTPTAKRLYTYLAKKKHGKNSFKINILKLAHALPIESEEPFNIRKILKEACEHLINEGILTGYELKRGAMSIIFYFPEERLKDSQKEESETLKLSDEKQKIYEQLIEIGVTDGVVKQLTQDHSTEKIERQLKWLNSRKSIDDPAGALVSSIKYDWAPPKEILQDKENKETQKQIESLLKKANNAKYIVLPSGKKRQILKVSDNVIEFIDENERRMIPTNQALNCKFED